MSSSTIIRMNAIEGTEILLSSLLITPHFGIPKKYCLIDGKETIGFPITLQRRGKSTIYCSYEPKAAKVRPESLLDKQAYIEGETLWGFSSSPIKADSVKIGEKASRSSAHKGQSTTVQGRVCFFCVITDYRNISLAMHPKDQLAVKP